MVVVIIPALMRPMFQGANRLEVEASTLDAALRALDARSPGFYDRLVEDGRVRPELAIAVNGEVYQMALHERLAPGTQLTIVPAIGGG